MEHKIYVVADHFKSISKNVSRLIIYFSVLEKCYGNIFCCFRKMWTEMVQATRINFLTESSLFSGNLFVIQIIYTQASNISKGESNSTPTRAIKFNNSFIYFSIIFIRTQHYNV